MSVVLIYPAIPFKLGDRYPTRTLSPPLGILYIASYLRENDVDIEVVDQNGEGISNEQLVKRITRISPDLVGFSVLAWQTQGAVELSKRIKEELPNTHIVFGGIHVTLNPMRMMEKYSQIDSIIVGEGERATLDLLRALQSNVDLNNIPGIYYRKNGAIKVGAPKQAIAQLDDLPFPARDLVNMKWYGAIEGMRFPGLTTILSSRGCPYACTFCCLVTFTERQWKSRSAENIVDEIEDLLNAGYKTIFFIDDNFTMSQKRILRICQLIKERRLDFDWLFEGRVDQIKYESVRNMVKSGLKLVYLGIESANQKCLDYYDKRITPQMAQQAVATTRRAGTDIILGTFIIGAPGETIAEVQNTIDFAMKLDLDFPQFNTLAAGVGTKIWDSLVSEGYVNEDELWENGVQVPEVHPKSVSQDVLLRMIEAGYDKFILRKGYIAKEILRFLSSSFRLRFLTHNFTKGSVLRQFVRGEISRE